MKSVGNGVSTDRRRAVLAVKDSLRDLNGELTSLNRRVSGKAGLKDIDLECLDLLVRDGPTGPSALARALVLHPATMTGVLDRLDHGGWIERGRDPADRRASVIRAAKNRAGEVYGLFSGMNSSLDDICSRYSDDELAVLSDFIARTAEAGRRAANALA